MDICSLATADVLRLEPYSTFLLLPYVAHAMHGRLLMRCITCVHDCAATNAMVFRAKTRPVGASGPKSSYSYVFGGPNRVLGLAPPQVCANDVELLVRGENSAASTSQQYALYSYGSQRLSVLSRGETMEVTLGGAKGDVVTVSPIQEVRAQVSAPCSQGTEGDNNLLPAPGSPPGVSTLC